MPTPDETAFPPSPPIDIPARSSFPSCPPEEEREDPRDDSDDSDDNDGEDEEAAAPPADHAIAQEPTPEPDVLEGASSTGDHNAQSHSKDRIVEDATTAHTPRPTTASHDAVVAQAESEVQAHGHAASSNPHASMSSFPPQYMDVSPDKDRVSAVSSSHTWDAC